MNLRFTCLGLLLAGVSSASAVSITLEYQNPSDSFFTPTAKATMTQAAADVSYAITTTLAALSQDVYAGTNGSTTATADWRLTYTNPLNGTSVVNLDTFNLASNEIKIYVGSRSISDGVLGVGGPGGAGVQFNGTGNSTQWPTAVANMQNASNAGMVRGGPVLGSISGSLPFGSSNPTYNVSYGYGVSSLAIDSSATWNLSYPAAPSAGQSDLYSVAVHEMLHDLGFGTGSTWDALASGTDWLGSNVIALLGTGVNVLSDDGAHIREGLTGHPLINGVFEMGITQEAAMDPTITSGTRKYITDLDLAFLKDMGWSVVAVPEPSTILLLALGAGIVGFSRRRERRSGV